MIKEPVILLIFFISSEFTCQKLCDEVEYVEKELCSEGKVEKWG